jgi:hypothetical protein
MWLPYVSSLPCQSDPSCGSKPANCNSTVDFGQRKEHAPGAYLSFLFPTSFYMGTNMHKFNNLNKKKRPGQLVMPQYIFTLLILDKIM